MGSLGVFYEVLAAADPRYAYSMYPLRYGAEAVVDSLSTNTYESVVATFEGRKKPIGDCMGVMGRYFVVSGAAASLFDEYVLHDAVWKTRVEAHFRSAVVSTDYWWYRSHCPLEVIDYEHSECDLVPGTDFPWRVRRCALRRAAVPQCDLFRGERTKWFISDRLRAEIVRLGLSNFAFEGCLPLV